MRYEIYVGEQSKAYPEADHVRRILTDELDAESVTVMVSVGEELAGTVRANWLPSNSLIARYGTVFQFDRFSGFCPETISVCSRLAVNARFRDNRARELLFETIYDVGLARSTCLCFATCAGRLLRLFHSYGFREYVPTVIDAAAGELHRTVLVLDDLAHLEKICSPFLKIALNRGMTHIERPWLNEIFAANAARLRSQLS